MKKFRYFLFVLLVLPCIILFGGCSLTNDEVYVTNIKHLSSDESQTVYEVSYSNNEKSYISVKNGKDGTNAYISIEDIFSAFVSRGIYEDNEQGFNDFVKDYIAGHADNRVNEVVRTQAVNKALPSTVSVYTKTPISGSTYYDIAGGAGVIISVNNDYSIILTCYHVVYNAYEKAPNLSENIWIYPYGVDHDFTCDSNLKLNKYYYYNIDTGASALECEYLAGSETYDLAVLKVDTTKLLLLNQYACAVDMAEDYSLASTAIAIGNPELENTSVTEGIVSVKSEYISISLDQTEQDAISRRVFRVDTAINGGNSGGGIFNTNGELIGICHAKTESEEIDNMAYCLPIDNVVKVVDSLLYNYSLGRSKIHTVQLGIKIGVNNTHAVKNKLGGYDSVSDVYINEVVGNSNLATKLGLKAGDVLKTLTINSKQHDINQLHDLTELLLTIKLNDEISVSYTRNDETKYSSAYKVAESDFVLKI